MALRLHVSALHTIALFELVVYSASALLNSNDFIAQFKVDRLPDVFGYSALKLMKLGNEIESFEQKNIEKFVYIAPNSQLQSPVLGTSFTSSLLSG